MARCSRSAETSCSKLKASQEPTCGSGLRSTSSPRPTPQTPSRWTIRTKFPSSNIISPAFAASITAQGSLDIRRGCPGSGLQSMAAKEFFDGKSVLLTGGSGSFGGALVSELLRTHKPRVLRVLDHDENALWTLESKFAADRRLRLLLGDIREPDRLLLALQDIDIVIHAAALKHVPSGEDNPFEAVKTNVLGTQNVIDAALTAGVGTVMLTSTDKAANPSNVMGTTKLLGEKLTIAANYYRGTRPTPFAFVT